MCSDRFKNTMNRKNCKVNGRLETRQTPSKKWLLFQVKLMDVDTIDKVMKTLVGIGLNYTVTSKTVPM